MVVVMVSVTVGIVWIRTVPVVAIVVMMAFAITPVLLVRYHGGDYSQGERSERCTVVIPASVDVDDIARR
jgi:hypothetical protein